MLKMNPLELVLLVQQQLTPAALLYLVWINDKNSVQQSFMEKCISFMFVD